HAGAVADARLDRLEPALDAAVQRVVRPGLAMRLMRLADYAPVRGGGVHGVAAAAITAVIGHVPVAFEAVPAAGKIIPVIQRAMAQEDVAHGRPGQQHETVARDGSLQWRLGGRGNGSGGHGRFPAGWKTHDGATEAIFQYASSAGALLQSARRVNPGTGPAPAAGPATWHSCPGR